MDVTSIASDGQFVDDAPRRAQEACWFLCRDVLANLVVRGTAVHALVRSGPEYSGRRN